MAALLTLLPVLAALPLVLGTAGSADAATSGFVTRNGADLALGGKPFRFAGANIYWLMRATDAQRNAALDAAVAQGVTVIRTWGFADVVNPSDAQDGVYLQSYDASAKRPVVNTGANGLGRLDAVVKAASDRNLRLIISLTNNYGDYGGMPKYSDWLNRATGAAQYHRDFYTNATIRGWFKDYVKAVVNRSNPLYSTPRLYKNDPTIMAWELANEPRCGDCANKPGDVTSWASDMSSYVKAQAPNQLVGVGDEGFKCGGGSYPDDCSDGIDSTQLTALPKVDYGSAHLYPKEWGYDSQAQSWGNSWITSRAAIAQNAGKPFVLGEFGSTNNRATTYASWYSTLQNSTADGDLIWQLSPTGNSQWTDQYTVVCPTDTSVCPLVKNHAAAVAGGSGGGTTASPTPTPTSTPTPSYRFDFEDGTTQGWETGWGNLSVGNSSYTAYSGAKALGLCLGGSGYPAARTTTGLSGLAPGTTVTYHVWRASDTANVTVVPYATDGSWNVTFTAERTLADGWNTVTWTVPSMTGLTSIGLQLDNGGGSTGCLNLDAVSW